MAQSITSNVKQINSQSTVVNRLTTPKLDKLHSSDIPFLKVLLFHYSKGSGKTFLKRSQWPLELQKFGGKPITYRPFKSKTAKLRRMGYIVAVREDRYKHSSNRNKEYTWYISEEGRKAVNNWPNNLKPPRKNSPSKPEKQPLVTQKTAPPLNHDERSEKHDSDVIDELNKKDTELGLIYLRLRQIGFYSKTALEAIRDYRRHELLDAYSLTREKRPKNPGAYMRKLLIKLYSKR